MMGIMERVLSESDKRVRLEISRLFLMKIRRETGYHAAWVLHENLNKRWELGLNPLEFARWCESYSDRYDLGG